MLRLLLAAATAALLFCAPAGAATFRVDPGASIHAAVTAARATPETDTIALAAGRFTEAVALADPADAGLTLVGAGDGATVLAAPEGALAVLEIGAEADGVRVRDLRIEHGGTTIAGVRRGRAAVVRGDGVTFDAVTAAAVSDDGQDHTLLTYGDGFTAHRLHTRAQGWSSGLIADRAVTITDSTHEGGYGGWESFGDEPSRFARVRVALAPEAGIGIGIQGPVEIDSALVSGGHTAIEFRPDEASGAAAVLRNVTLDAGARGAAEPIPGPEERGVRAVYAGAGSVLVDSSVLIDGIVAWWDAAARCEFSAIRGQVDPGTEEGGAIACPATAQGNLPSSPALLTADHALAAGSPARDAGRPGPLAAGASTTDLAGAPRIAEPGACAAGRLDMGAFEAPAVACTPTGCEATASCPPSGCEVTASCPPPGCDAAGSCPPATCTAAAPPCLPGAPSADRDAPRLRGVALVRRGRRATLRGTTSEAARLRAVIQRCGPGRGCKRPVTARRTTAQVTAGRFSLFLSLRGLRHRRHRVLLTAVDAAGNARAARPLTLTIR